MTGEIDMEAPSLLSSCSLTDFTGFFSSPSSSEMITTDSSGCFTFIGRFLIAGIFGAGSENLPKTPSYGCLIKLPDSDFSGELVKCSVPWFEDSRECESFASFVSMVSTAFTLSGSLRLHLKQNTHHWVIGASVFFKKIHLLL